MTGKGSRTTGKGSRTTDKGSRMTAQPTSSRGVRHPAERGISDPAFGRMTVREAG